MKDAESRMKSSRSKEEALEHAIEASELYMKSINLADNPVEKSRLRRKCLSAMDRAEDIKKMRQWPIYGSSISSSEGSKKHLLRPPTSTREPTAKEKLILLKGSRLHGSIFPPWTEEPSDDEFSAVKGPYLNPIEVPVSDEHTRDFAGWLRPADLTRSRARDGDSPRGDCTPTMLPVAAVDLVQDVTADCSVVASLCSALARPGSSYDDLLHHMIYPFDDLLRIPKTSANGKYVLRFNFNGCFRKVVIDDRLPGSRTSRTLHVVDRSQPGLLWPALIEKAYLTVRGGYDFPGSNSGTDLWVITGWIPEQICLQSEELEAQAVWNRLKKSFTFGDVIVTLGTGRISSRDESVLGLVGEHDYAVLDMRESDRKQQLLVKNPWCDGATWKPANEEPLHASQKRGPNDNEVDSSDTRIDSSGAVWIDYGDVVSNFNSLYLNWNPGLFQYRQDHHFEWKIPEVSSRECFTHNPQYSLLSPGGGMVWVLLSRHFTTEDHRHFQHSHDSSHLGSRNDGFMGIYTYDAAGRRVHLSDNALSRGLYVDSPQTLAKLDMPAGSCYTIVLAQQDLPLKQYSFTLSAYSSVPVVIDRAAEQYPHAAALDGAWSTKSAGGNAEAVTYPSNPQYKLIVPSATALNIVLEAAPRDLAVHVKLLWAAGRRVTSVTSQNIAADSGDYRRGCAVAYISNVPAGVYTIVCSTFDAGRTGSFRLSVEAMVLCDLEPLASEDAGRLIHRMPNLLLRDGVDRMLAPIAISRVTRLKVAAHHATLPHGGRAHSPLRISLEVSQGPNKRVISTSNDARFSDAPGGVRTGDVDVSADSVANGGLWLVVERYGALNAVDEIQTQILSDTHLVVGAWGTGDG